MVEPYVLTVRLADGRDPVRSPQDTSGAVEGETPEQIRRGERMSLRAVDLHILDDVDRGRRMSQVVEPDAERSCGVDEGHSDLQIQLLTSRQESAGSAVSRTEMVLEGGSSAPLATDVVTTPFDDGSTVS